MNTTPASRTGIKPQPYNFENLSHRISLCCGSGGTNTVWQFTMNLASRTESGHSVDAWGTEVCQSVETRSQTLRSAGALFTTTGRTTTMKTSMLVTTASRICDSTVRF